VEVEISPEDLYIHGATKTAITSALHALIVETEQGAVFSDSTRVVSVEPGPSVEYDLVVVLWRTIEEGRVREVPAASGKPGRYIELEGAPDLIVETVSDSSTGKGKERFHLSTRGRGFPSCGPSTREGRRCSSIARCSARAPARASRRTSAVGFVPPSSATSCASSGSR
jgi:hypothetical protein